MRPAISSTCFCFLLLCLSPVASAQRSGGFSGAASSIVGPTLTAAPSYPALVNSPYSAFDNSGVIGGAIVNIVEGGGPTLACSLFSGLLPAGMSLSEITPTSYPDGLCILTGTPTTAGSYSFTIQVSDGTNTATQAVTFIVNTTTPPVISSKLATIIDFQTVKFTWATDVLSSSKVCWAGITFNGTPDTCTAETDLAGTLSHSVQITGCTALGNNTNACVFSNVGSQWFPVSRAISGGAPVEWSKTSVTQCSSCSDSFTTPAPPTTGAIDFAMTPVGAQNILQGFPLIVGIYAWDKAGTSFHQSWKIVVTGIPTNSQVHWPDQQDNHAGGSVSTTTTTNDTLGIFSPTAVEFEILTNVGGTTPVGNYTLTVTATEIPTAGCSCSNAVHSLTWPMNVSVSSFVPSTPSNYPTIPALATWQSNMTTYGNKWCGQTIGANEGTAWYYDGQDVFYKVKDYTADATAGKCPNGVAPPGTALGPTQVAAGNYAWTDAAFQVQLANQAYINSTTPHGQVTAIRQFPFGLYQAWTRNGDSSARQSLSDIAVNAATHNMWASIFMFPDATNTREACYKLGVQRLFYDAGFTTSADSTSVLASVKQMATTCLGELDQVVNGLTGFKEPFLDALADLELIDYYNDPNFGPDARIPAMIKAHWDFEWANHWLPMGGTNGAFIYNETFNNNGVPTQGLGANNGLNVTLDLLIAPTAAWLFKITGLPIYQRQFDTVFNAGTMTPASNGIDVSGKNFSQNYRWTTDAIKYRSFQLIPGSISGSGNITGSGVVKNP